MRFFDSSAIVKLVLGEAESVALKNFVGGVTFAASELALTEVIRVVRRREPGRVELAQDIVGQAQLVTLTSASLATAARLEPASLRSLDAIHLASALVLGDELEVFVAYDERLLSAAAALGMPVASPGA